MLVLLAAGRHRPGSVVPDSGTGAGEHGTSAAASSCQTPKPAYAATTQPAADVSRRAERSGFLNRDEVQQVGGGDNGFRSLCFLRVAPLTHDTLSESRRRRAARVTSLEKLVRMCDHRARIEPASRHQDLPEFFGPNGQGRGYWAAIICTEARA